MHEPSSRASGTLDAAFLFVVVGRAPATLGAVQAASVRGGAPVPPLRWRLHSVLGNPRILELRSANMGSGGRLGADLGGRSRRRILFPGKYSLGLYVVLQELGQCGGMTNRAWSLGGGGGDGIELAPISWCTHSSRARVRITCSRHAGRSPDEALGHRSSWVVISGDTCVESVAGYY